MKKNAFKKIEKQYSLEKMIDKYEELFKNNLQ